MLQVNDGGLGVCTWQSRQTMHFGHDVLHKIFSIIAEDGSRHDLLTLCLVCIGWKRVASDFYWRRLALSTSGDPTRLDTLIRHFATKSSATAFYPTKHAVVTELSVKVKESQEDDNEAFRQKVLRLAGLLRSVHTLHLNVMDSKYRGSDDSLKEITCLLVDQLPALKHMALTADGLNMGVKSIARKKRDTEILQILTDLFKRVTLVSLDLSDMCPDTNWFSLQAMLNAQFNLHTLKVGFVFDDQMQFILGRIAKANLNYLRRLDFQVRPAYTNEAYLYPSGLDEFRQHMLDDTNDFVNVCTNLEHFGLEVDDLYQDFLVNAWTFLGHMSRLQRLRVLRVDIRFFDLSQKLPVNFKLTFPKVQAFHLLGHNDDMGMGIKLMRSLVQWEWPVLEYVDGPRRFWVPNDLKHVLKNAPCLRILDVHCGFIPLDEVASVFTHKVFPQLKMVCIRSLDERSLHEIKTILVQVLRTACPRAIIHIISMQERCRIYYGVHARLHKQAANAEPVNCGNPNHTNKADYYDDDENPDDDYDNAYYGEYDPYDYDDLHAHVDPEMMLAFEQAHALFGGYDYEDDDYDDGE
jgi:hypothetical protein